MPQGPWGRGLGVSLAGWLALHRLAASGAGAVTLAWAAAADHCRPPCLGSPAMGCALSPPALSLPLPAELRQRGRSPSTPTLRLQAYLPRGVPTTSPGAQGVCGGDADGRGQGSRLKCPFSSSGSAQKKTTPAEVSVLGGPPSLPPEGGRGSTLPCPRPAPWP